MPKPSRADGMYKAPIDMNINSMSGHSIILKRGVPTYLVPQLRDEAQRRGCVKCTDEGAVRDVSAEVAPDPDLEAAELKAVVFKVFEDMQADNHPAEFTANGEPKANVVQRRLRKMFPHMDITSKERSELWEEFTSK